MASSTTAVTGALAEVDARKRLECPLQTAQSSAGSICYSSASCDAIGLVETLSLQSRCMQDHEGYGGTAKQYYRQADVECLNHIS